MTLLPGFLRSGSAEVKVPGGSDFCFPVWETRVSGSFLGKTESSSATAGQGQGETTSERLPPLPLVLRATASCFFLFLSEVVLRENNADHSRDPPWAGVCGTCVCVCVCVCLCLQRREPHSSSDEPQGSQLLIGSCLGDPPKPLSPELYYLKRESI